MKIGIIVAMDKEMNLLLPHVADVSTVTAITVALCPPKPKEFDRAARTVRFCARSNVKLSE